MVSVMFYLGFNGGRHIGGLVGVFRRDTQFKVHAFKVGMFWVGTALVFGYVGIYLRLLFA